MLRLFVIVRGVASSTVPIARHAVEGDELGHAVGEILRQLRLEEREMVLAALEAAIVMSVNKKGLGEFTLPGLLKVVVHNVPAKKKRMGKDPFTGVERMFAAKPASVKIKTRALKKLKDAAL